MADDLVWATAVSKNETTHRAIIFRYVEKLPPDFKKESQPFRVIIQWKYKSESGQPDKAEREEMDRFEDLITPAVEEDRQSTLALVSTGEELREWIWYTTSDDRFLEQLNAALRSQSRFPIDILTAKDSEWQSWNEFHRGVKRDAQLAVPADASVSRPSP